eukprot:g49976.t1
MASSLPHFNLGDFASFSIHLCFHKLNRHMWLTARQATKAFKHKYVINIAQAVLPRMSADNKNSLTCKYLYLD